MALRFRVWHWTSAKLKTYPFSGTWRGVQTKAKKLGTGNLNAERQSTSKATLHRARLVKSRPSAQDPVPPSTTSSSTGRSLSWLEREAKPAIALLKRRIWTFLGICFVVHAFITHGYAIQTPVGPSMLPSIDLVGQWIIIDLTCRHGRRVKVGDMVTYQQPNADYISLKRVVGMPGDLVLAGTPGATGGEMGAKMLQVPKGHFYAAGDNQAWSRDSRMIGPVPLALVKGKAIFSLAPLSKFGPIRNLLRDVDLSSLSS